MPRYPAQRPSRLAPETIALLDHARRELEYGAARTRVWLRRVHQIHLPMATIQHAFRRMGVPRLPRRRKRPPRPKQLRLFEKPHPGDSVQIDVKVVTVNARKCFQYTALDDCTRLRVLRLSREQNQRSSLAFLEQVRQSFPFPIRKVQTDHGTEFSLDFVLGVEQAGIRHRYIQPRRPQQNGKVERSHRIDNEEFWGMPDLFRAQIQSRADKLVNLKDKYLIARGASKREYSNTIAREERAIADEVQAHVGPGVIDWRIHFADVFAKNGGFDIVLANPPYISAIEFSRTRSTADRAALSSTFASAKGAYDLYVVFFERAVQLLRPAGVLSFITPNKYLSARYAVSLRDYLRTHCEFLELVDLSGIPVFDKTAVYPVLSFFARRSTRKYQIKLLQPLSRNLSAFDLGQYRQTAVADEMLDLLPERIWGFLLSDNLSLLRDLVAGSIQLKDLGEVSATTTASEADDYGAKLQKNGGPQAFRVVNTGTIDPFQSLWGRHEMVHGGTKFLTPYLRRSSVSQRRQAIYANPKVIFAKMARSCEAMLDASGQYASLNTNCYFAPKRGLTLEYVCAFCHSPVFAFLYEQFFGALRMSGGYFQFQAPQLRVIPVRMPDDRTLRIVTTLVQQLIRRLETGASGRDREIRELRNEIDGLIHAVYGLRTDDVALPVSRAEFTPAGGVRSKRPSADRLPRVAEHPARYRPRRGRKEGP